MPMMTEKELAKVRSHEALIAGHEVQRWPHMASPPASSSLTTELLMARQQKIWGQVADTLGTRVSVMLSNPPIEVREQPAPTPRPLSLRNLSAAVRRADQARPRQKCCTRSSLRCRPSRSRSPC